MLPETRYARSGDVHIAYQVIGDGPFDLVFVPGFISHVDHVWDEPRWSGFLERLASFSRLICFDKRGTGLSDRVSAIPTLEQRMDDARAVVDAVRIGARSVLRNLRGRPDLSLITAKFAGKKIVISSHRRQFLFSTAAAAVMSLIAAPTFAQGGSAGGKFVYRGFTVDSSAAQDLPNSRAIEASLKHQIDIVADSGASPAISGFFKSQEIMVKAGQGDGGGHFSANSKGVTVDAAVDAPEKPVVLHELLHAYHFRVLPGALQNPDVLRFYDNAKQGEFYPPDSYVLKNVQEFFAVTASLYLWGNVDRPPHTRGNLRDKQPVYYKWLGQLFGVQKNS